MLGLLLLTLLPLALFGGFDGGDDNVADDDSLTGDDTLSGGSGGGDIFDPGTGGGTTGGGSSGGGSSGGGVPDTYDELQRGTDANDTLSGGDFEDLLIGQAGDDSLSGGLDADVIFAFAGNDFLKGDGGMIRCRAGLAMTPSGALKMVTSCPEMVAMTCCRVAAVRTR